MAGDLDGKRKIPPPRSLDVYRLVVCRTRRQVEAAGWFEVSAVRVCQIVSRVRRWVDEEVGEWLFPRRDDLRFYAALAAAGVEVQEVEGKAESVVLVGRGWSYRRGIDGWEEAAGCGNSATATTSQEPSPRPSPGESGRSSQGLAHSGAHLSAGAIKANDGAAGREIDGRASGDGDSVPAEVGLLGRRLAELLIEWQKSRSLAGAVRGTAFQAVGSRKGHGQDAHATHGQDVVPAHGQDAHATLRRAGGS